MRLGTDEKIVSVQPGTGWYVLVPHSEGCPPSLDPVAAFVITVCDVGDQEGGLLVFGYPMIALGDGVLNLAQAVQLVHETALHGLAPERFATPAWAEDVLREQRETEQAARAFVLPLRSPP